MRRTFALSGSMKRKAKNWEKLEMDQRLKFKT